MLVLHLLGFNLMLLLLDLQMLSVSWVHRSDSSHNTVIFGFAFADNFGSLLKNRIELFIKTSENVCMVANKSALVIVKLWRCYCWQDFFIGKGFYCKIVLLMVLHKQKFHVVSCDNKMPHKKMKCASCLKKKRM